MGDVSGWISDPMATPPLELAAAPGSAASSNGLGGGTAGLCTVMAMGEGMHPAAALARKLRVFLIFGQSVSDA